MRTEGSIGSQNDLKNTRREAKTKKAGTWEKKRGEGKVERQRDDMVFLNVYEQKKLS